MIRMIPSGANMSQPTAGQHAAEELTSHELDEFGVGWTWLSQKDIGTHKNRPGVYGQARLLDGQHFRTMIGWRWTRDD